MKDLSLNFKKIQNQIEKKFKEFNLDTLKQINNKNNY